MGSQEKRRLRRGGAFEFCSFLLAPVGAFHQQLVLAAGQRQPLYWRLPVPLVLGGIFQLNILCPWLQFCGLVDVMQCQIQVRNRSQSNGQIIRYQK